MSIFIRTVPNVMRHYGCTAEDAQRFIDLREEGYSTHQAALMAGLSDPPEPAAHCVAPCPSCQGDGYHNEGDPEVGNVYSACKRCSGTGRGVEGCKP